MAPDRQIVMSGMRPTGRLHLGNFWTLKSWLSLQERCECYFCVADWHMFTTGYEETGRLRENVREMVLDWLAAGLDPERCVVFRQSDVPQHAELALLLSMLTPISWLENNPTYKEQLQDLAKTKLAKAVEEKGGVPAKSVREKIAGQALEAVEPDDSARAELRTHGFLGYPVLQAADIALYRADIVPVGQDQAAHVEISREIVRRFNSIYGEVLVEPQARICEVPRLPGVDGRKMSKSYGNAIELVETQASLSQKVMSMFTDPLKVRANDKGHPEGCVVFAMHRLYSGYHRAREAECREGRIGCVACKKDLLRSLEPAFDEFRRNRQKYSAEGQADAVLEAGARKAAQAAERTMQAVRRAVNLR